MASGKGKISCSAAPAASSGAAATTTAAKVEDKKAADEPADVDMGAGGLFGEEEY
jgi:ribosomal protein L12E/L44/L45/RPP1/RPP2